MSSEEKKREEEKRAQAPPEIEQAHTRARIYRFLSNSFKKEAKGESVDRIPDLVQDIETLGIAEQQTEISSGVRNMKQFRERMSRLDEEELEGKILDLAVEFTEMFLGTGAKPVYTSESLYEGTSPTLYGKPYFEVDDADNGNGDGCASEGQFSHICCLDYNGECWAE